MSVYTAESGRIMWSFMVQGYREHCEAYQRRNENVFIKCKDEKEAKKFENKRKNIVSAMLNGEIEPDEKVKAYLDKKEKDNPNRTYTVKDLCDRYLQYGIEKKKKSLDKDKLYIAFFMRYFGENKDVRKIFRSDVIKMREYILTNHKKKNGLPVSNRTPNLYTSALRKAFNVLIDDQIELQEKYPRIKIEFLNNPCKRLTPLKYTPTLDRRGIPKEKREEFFSYLPYPQRDMIELDFMVGLRSTNIKYLNVTQINMEQDRINISAEDNKSGKDISIKMNKRAREIIAKYYYNAEYYLFLNPRTGKPINSYRKTFATAAKKVGCPWALPHSVRREFGKDVYKLSGNNIEVARKALHHSSYEMTQIYIEAEQSKVDDIIEILAS